MNREIGTLKEAREVTVELGYYHVMQKKKKKKNCISYSTSNLNAKFVPQILLGRVSTFHGDL